MSTRITRRQMLKFTSALTAAAVVGRSRRVAAAPPFEVESVTTVSQQPHLYHGWPTLARRNDGELLLVCSGGREAHVCPFGRVELMRSRDNGRTWSWPRVLLDGPIDDRDSGVLVTAQGSILVTTFTSLAFEPILASAESAKTGDASAWPADKLARWKAARDRISAERRKQELGVWMIRSTDDGVTWSARYDCLVNSPHGPVQLSDGRLLYAGKQLWSGDGRIGVCESTDDGQTWRWLAEIPTRQGDDHREYHELHAVQTAGGRIIAQIRNHNKQNSQETLQTESSDGGRTWSAPHPIGVWGYPSHLLRLKDDRLLMSYGHRRAPLGNQARLSDDDGRTWSEPIVVYGDGTSGDLGYPSTVQSDDGSLLTAWYERLKSSPKAVLRLARWRLTS